MCIAISILVCITGDSEKTLLYFLIVFLFYLIINTNIINIKRACYLVLAILFITNISSLARVGIFKFYKKEQLTSQPQNQKYKTQSIITNNKNYPFIVENEESMDTILNEFKEAHPDKTKDLFEGIVYDHSSFGLLYRIPRDNVYYIDLLNEILFMFHNKLNKNDKVLFLEFINPLPILLNLKPIKGAYHWFHLGFTFSSKTIHRFDKTFEGSDFVYMPLFSILPKHSILKCHFYKWNFHHKRFTLSSVHKYGFLFATPQKIEEHNLGKLEFPNPGKITESCLAIEDDLIEREKSQQRNILNRLLQKFFLRYSL